MKDFEPMVDEPFKFYQKVYNFPNGYGASVICKSKDAFTLPSYGEKLGLFELGIMRNGAIVYGVEPVPRAVAGFLDFSDVADLLEKIKNLPNPTL